MIVQHDADAHVTTSAGFDADIRLIFEFHATSPLSVSMTFDLPSCGCKDCETGGPVGPTWVLDRMILADVLVNDGLQGIGDVQASRDGDTVFLFLDSPEGTAAVKINTLDLSAFVREIFELVPEDEASQSVQDQMDAWLSEVLIGGE